MSILGYHRLLREEDWGFDGGGGGGDTAKKYLSRHDDWLSKQEVLCTRFLNAVRTGKISRVKKMLRQDVGLDKLDKDGALAMAVTKNSKDMVLLLLDAGASVNARKGEALSNAITFQKPDMVRLLLERGADARIEDDKCLMFAYHFTYVTNHTPCLDHLLRHIFRAEAWEYKQPGEMEAVMEHLSGRFPALRSQISALAEETRAANDKLCQALFLSAADRADIGQIQESLKSGTVSASSQQVALRVAAIKGTTDVVRVLLDHGGDLGEATNMALHSAIEHSGVEHKHEDIVRLLLARDRDIDADGALVYAGARYHNLKPSREDVALATCVRRNRVVQALVAKGLRQIAESLIAYIFRPTAWRGKTAADIDAKYQQLQTALNEGGTDPAIRLGAILQKYATSLKETLDPLYEITELVDQHSRQTPEEREQGRVFDKLTAIPLPRL